MSGPIPSPLAARNQAKQAMFGHAAASIVNQTNQDIVVSSAFNSAPAINNHPTAKSSPLANPKTIDAQRTYSMTANLIPFKDSDIDTLGADVQQSTMGVVKQLTEKMAVAKFGDLGEMLANVQLEADRLDPSAKSDGLVSWVKTKVFDVRKMMLKQLTTAGATFDMLAEKMASHVAVHETWVKDLDLLYLENYEQYNRILEVIRRGETWEAAAVQALSNLPTLDTSDPEAPMKVQLRRDAESMLNRLRQRIDNFRRLKVLTECNGPRIRSQQESSRDSARTLRDYSEQVIPIIKMEFAMYLQSQDVKKTGSITSGARNLAESSLKRSADSAKESIIDAANQANTAIISNDAMNHMRSRLLEAVTTVKSIESSAQQRRVDDAKMMNDQQSQYLTQLQQHGAPI